MSRVLTDEASTILLAFTKIFGRTYDYFKFTEIYKGSPTWKTNNH